MFQKLLFYNVLLEKSSVKLMKDIYLLRGLPFYKELNIVKSEKRSKRYAKTFKFEISDSKDPLVRLEASKSSIKYLFKVLLNEINSFTYQITLKFLLRKYKENGDVEFPLVFF